MTNIHSVYTVFLKASDLPTGQTVRKTIVKTAVEKQAGYQGKPDVDKVVITLNAPSADKPQPKIAINQTQAEELAKFLGDEIESWVNGKIIIDTKIVSFGGKDQKTFTFYDGTDGKTAI